jgi:hypothetical protein
VRIATAPYTNEPLILVVILNEYESLSVPSEQIPPKPFVFPDTIAPIGFELATPEYRVTTITALLGALAKVAVTTPPLAFP